MTPPGAGEPEDLPQMLLSAQEDERRKIAVDLHDGVGQHLSAVRFGLEGLRQHLGDRLACHEEDKLACLVGLVGLAIEEVRRLSNGLRPPMLDDLGVVSAIDWFCAELRMVFTNMEVIQSVRAEEEAIPPPVKVAIFRILQEGCTNACKHSGATRLFVRLETDAEGIRLEVSDDGVGFNPASVQRSRTGLGLVSMRERATLSNGCLTIRSQPGAGTRIFGAWCAEARAECTRKDSDRNGDLRADADACIGRLFGSAHATASWAS